MKRVNGSYVFTDDEQRALQEAKEIVLESAKDLPNEIQEIYVYALYGALYTGGIPEMMRYANETASEMKEGRL